MTVVLLEVDGWYRFVHLIVTSGTLTEIQVGPVQRIDLPPLYVKDSNVFGLKGAFLTAKDAL